MKFIINAFMVFLAISLTFSCVDEDLVNYGSETNASRNDAFLEVLINTPVVSFVAGNENYDIDFLVVSPDSDEVTRVDVYTQFVGAEGESNEVLLNSYDIPAGQNTTNITDQITYDQLRDGLMLNGSALPDNQVELPVGASWTLRLDPVNTSGETVFSAGNITVAILSPFAGTYRVIESGYFRIGVESGATDWTGTEIFIGSVDENTFSHNGWWGPFEQDGFFVFDINADDSVTIPDDPSQLFFSGDEMLTCQNDSGQFPNVPCAGSNTFETTADGGIILRLTYGYLTLSGDENEGAREFYEVMEKID